MLLLVLQPLLLLVMLLMLLLILRRPCHCWCRVRMHLICMTLVTQIWCQLGHSLARALT